MANLPYCRYLDLIWRPLNLMTDVSGFMGITIHCIAHIHEPDSSLIDMPIILCSRHDNNNPCTTKCRNL